MKDKYDTEESAVQNEGEQQEELQSEKLEVSIPMNEEITVKATPVPKGGLIAVVAVLISEGCSFSFLFPFVGFMIIDFGMVKDERDAGYYAGTLAGIYSLCQFFSGFVFGILADRASKRVVVIISTIGGIISLTLFGFSPSYYWAFAFRALNGTLNGNLATAKAYLADITDASNQAVAFSFVGVAWGIGVVGGPAIGGFLSNPATKYPSLFGRIPVFQKHPYLLPCLFTSGIQLLSIACSAFLMKHHPKNTQQPLERSTETDVELQESTEANEPLSPNSPSANESLLADQFEQPERSHRPIRVFARIKQEIEELVTLCRNTEVAICIILYALTAFMDVFHEESFPLWALIQQKKGGLSFKTNQIGIVQMTTGILMVLEPIVYPKITRTIGVLASSRIGFCIYGSLVLTPLLNKLANVSMTALGFGLAGYTVVRSATEMMAFTSIFIMINNASPDGTAGRAHAISTSAGCLSRAAAPFLAGPTMAFFSRLASEVSGLFIHAPFFILTITCSVAILLTLKLPKAINEPLKKTL